MAGTGFGGTSSVLALVSTSGSYFLASVESMSAHLGFLDSAGGHCCPNFKFSAVRHVALVEVRNRLLWGLVKYEWTEFFSRRPDPLYRNPENSGLFPRPLRWTLTVTTCVPQIVDGRRCDGTF